MSLGYSISIEIEKENNTETIKQIIDKSLLLGYKYQQFLPGNFNENNLFLSQKQAIAIASKGDIENDIHALVIKIKDTYGTIHFQNYSGRLGLMLHNFYYPWLKKFEDGDEDIDIGKYAKVMLDLVEDYKILEMRIEKD